MFNERRYRVFNYVDYAVYVARPWAISFVTLDSVNIDLLPEKLRGEKEVLRSAVNAFQTSYTRGTAESQDDLELFKKYIQSTVLYSSQAKYGFGVKDKLWEKKEFIVLALKIIYLKQEKEKNGDKRIILEALNKIPSRLWEDKEFLQYFLNEWASTTDCSYLARIPENLKKDPDINEFIKKKEACKPLTPF